VRSYEEILLFPDTEVLRNLLLLILADICYTTEFHIEILPQLA
jgi:hypothetical protein